MAAGDTCAGTRAVELPSRVAGVHAALVGVPVPSGLVREIVQPRRIVVLERGRELPVQRGDVQLVEVMAMPLRCADRVQFHPVAVAELVLRRDVERPRVVPGPVDQAVTRVASHRGGHREVADLPRGRGHRRLEQVAAAEFLLEVVTGSLLAWVGDDVERSADGRRGQVDRAEAALELDACGGITHPGPVGPVDPSVLHVVDGHAVDHYRGVALVEPAHVDAGVAGAAALSGRIHRRRDVQHQGQIPRTQLGLDLGLRHVAERHRRAALLRAFGEHLDPSQRQRRRGHRKVRHVGSAGLDPELPALGRVADQLDRHVVRSGRHADDVESSAVVGEPSVLGPGLGLRQNDLGARQARSIGGHAPRDRTGLLGAQRQRQEQQGWNTTNQFHPDQPPLEKQKLLTEATRPRSGLHYVRQDPNGSGPGQ